MSTLSWNLRTSNSWNSQYLSRAVMVLLYIVSFENTVLTFCRTDWLRKIWCTSAWMDRYMADFRTYQLRYRGETRYRVSRRGRLHFFKMARVTHIERAYISATGQAVVQVVYSNSFWRQTCDFTYGNWKSLVSLLSNKNNQQCTFSMSSNKKNLEEIRPVQTVW